MRGVWIVGVALIAGLSSSAPAFAAQVIARDGVAVFEAHTTGCHALRAVALDDARRFVVQGSVCMKKSAALHHLARRGRYVIANLWTDIEIYDFADPKRPQLVRSFILDETHPAWGGGGLVNEGDRMLVLGTTVSAELSMSGAPSEWRVRNLDVTPDLKRRTENFSSGESREKDPSESLGADTRVVPLDGRLFEVRWDATRPQRGVIRHRQYLRARQSGATLLIDTRDETID